jgi:hypothetical protein
MIKTERHASGPYSFTKGHDTRHLFSRGSGLMLESLKDSTESRLSNVRPAPSLTSPRPYEPGSTRWDPETRRSRSRTGARNGAGEECSERRLRALVAGHPELSAGELCCADLDEAHGFACATEPCDDITHVVVKRNGSDGLSPTLIFIALKPLRREGRSQPRQRSGDGQSSRRSRPAIRGRRRGEAHRES